MKTGGGYSTDNERMNANWQDPPRKSNRRKWIIMGSILALIGIIIIAVVVAVVVSNNNKKNTNASSKTSSNSSSSGGVKQTDPNDPSTFVKDGNLHQAFYGMAYTPVGSQLPDCGNTLPAVIQDIQIMSQLTKRIRLYGADCNQSALVLEAIKQTKVDMTVWLGNYPIATDDNAAYQRQRDIIKSAIQTYGTDHIGGVTVGNEFMLNYLNANGALDPNSAVGNAGAAILIADIQDTRNMLASLALSKTLPVGTADAGSYFNTQVLEAVDYGMANVHPWFANVTVEVSAGWTADFFAQQDVSQANALSNKPTMYIAETGWPTKSSDAGNANNGASDASLPNLQTFLDTFVCQANTNGTGYFFFEFADEDWKDKQFGGVEGWWGLFNQDRTLKDIKIPTCQSP
ncbi:glycoside hydrolase superfamily [Crassisporium funariophilum]|nr:glycoside hydrolase superfamily [Crassisporium funariophilum]